MGGGHIIVFMTASNPEEGASIGKKAVEEGLAACCSIVPRVRSIYRWEGKVCDEEEALCVFKTRAALFDALKSRIRGLHSYKVPEIVAVEITSGLEEYLGWIDGATGGV